MTADGSVADAVSPRTRARVAAWHAVNNVSATWIRFWMRYAGLTRRGRLAMRLAAWAAPPYKAREYLAQLNPRGYVDPGATIHHGRLDLGRHVFIGKDVIVFDYSGGGPVHLGDFTRVYSDALLETGQGGSISVGANSRIHRGCHLIAYKSPIQIGRDVGLAPNCAVYSYDHGMHPDLPVSQQPLQSKGPVVIGDHVWLGTGVIVLSGTRIGSGAIVASGAVVTEDIPDGAIAAGMPARVVKLRREIRAAPAS